MICIMFQSVIWTPTHCCVLNDGIGGIYTTRFLLTNLAIWLDDLSKVIFSLTFSLLLTFMAVSRSASGSSTISNQLEARSIMVSAMKSIAEPSLPLRVYGPIRLTHSASHGVLITILDGRWPYFSVRLLLTWHDLHDFVMDRMVVCIPFQYNAAFIIPSRQLCPGCWR